MRVALLAMVLALGGLAAPAAAYTPNDPVVQQMVKRGSDYLASLTGEDYAMSSQGFSGGVGERALIAYAHYKINHDPSHPVVERGVKAVEEVLRGASGGGGRGHNKLVYTVSVSVLLLAEVDPVRFEDELKQLQAILQDLQFANGAFGYFGDTRGDVSQTQYALLAIWTLDRAGFPLDYPRVKQAAEWLLRVQDRSGGWPYHGKDPGPGSAPISQEGVDMSMTLAGGSSLLIAGDALGAWGDTSSGQDPQIEGLPAAVKIHRENEFKQRRARVKFPKEPIFRAIRFCERWQQENPYERNPKRIDWYYYQIYTQERYESFIEIAQGLPKDQSPAWYNKGVEELRQYQDPATGAWGKVGRAHTQPPISTAFALLFLIRSTQTVIFEIGSGTLAGGYDLPSDTTDIRVEGTQIKGRAVANSVSDMLDILEEEGADDLDGKSLPEDLKLADDPEDQAAQLDRLERLVRGSQSWQARRVAARVLGTSDQLRVVPSLIYALSDPDSKVRRHARDSLRFISRKFEGFGMPDDPTDQEIREAQRRWRDWYRKMDPGHVFLDYDL